MRLVVSTLGLPTYGPPKYIVKITLPAFNKDKDRVINSSSFVVKSKEWNILQSEIKTYLDVVNLCQSVSIDKVIEILHNDTGNLQKQTKCINYV